MAGRRSKLNKKLITEAAGLLRAGNYAETAAACVGISQATWYNWLKDAREQDKPDPLKVEFLEAVEKATAEAERKYVKVIEKATARNWQAAAWWLERRMPDKWGRRDTHKHEHKVDYGVMRVTESPDVTDWESLAKQQQAVMGGGNGRTQSN